MTAPARTRGPNGRWSPRPTLINTETGLPETLEGYYPAVRLDNGAILPQFKRSFPELNALKPMRAGDEPSGDHFLLEHTKQEIDYLLAYRPPSFFIGEEDSAPNMTLKMLARGCDFSTAAVNKRYAETGEGKEDDNPLVSLYLPCMSSSRSDSTLHCLPKGLKSGSIRLLNMGGLRCLYPQAANNLELWAQRFVIEACIRGSLSDTDVANRTIIVHKVIFPIDIVEALPGRFYKVSDYHVFVSADQRTLVTDANLNNKPVSELMETLADALAEPLTEKEFLEKWSAASLNELQKRSKAKHEEVRALRKSLIKTEAKAGHLDSQLRIMKNATDGLILSQADAIRKLGGVAKLELRSGALRVITEDIFATYRGDDYFMGRYEIDIAFDGTAKVRNLLSVRPNGLRPHPHCFTDSARGICLGGYQQLLSSNMLSYNLSGVVAVIIDFLGSIVDNDPLVSSAISDGEFLQKRKADDQYFKGKRVNLGAFKTEADEDEDEEADEDED